jgi:hypothetical protein
MAGVQFGATEKCLVGRASVAPRRDGQGRVGGSGTEGPWGGTGVRQLFENGLGLQIRGLNKCLNTRAEEKLSPHSPAFFLKAQPHFFSKGLWGLAPNFFIQSHVV